MAQSAIAPCQYKVGKVLGEGAYAKVKEAVHIETGEMFAVKIFNKKLMHGREHMILNEISILKSVSQGHPNLVSLIDYFESPNNLYVVTELCRGGELFYRICKKGHYYEKDAAALVRSIVDAVAYLHDKGVAHRDLKPENILFKTDKDDSQLLISDFGLAKILESDNYPVFQTLCGTPGYMAPEILQRKPYDKSVDMWAIGVITFFLLCGYTPFDRNSSVEEIQAIVKGDYAFEPADNWESISASAKDFIKSLLRLNPADRMTARQALEHPWLSVSSAASTTPSTDLLPFIKRSSRKFKKAVDAILVVNSLEKEMKKHRENGVGGRAAETTPTLPLPVDEQL